MAAEAAPTRTVGMAWSDLSPAQLETIRTTPDAVDKIKCDRSA